MTINFNELHSVQSEILKAYSPQQEFALLNLKLDSDVTDDVVFLAQSILVDFPHFAKLYDGFAQVNEDPEVCPFIVPVANSDHVMTDILDVCDSQLVVSSALLAVLNYAYERIPKREYTADELDSMRHIPLMELVDVQTPKPVLTKQIVEAIVSGLRFGIEPIVIRPTPKQREARSHNLMSNKTLFRLFGCAA